MCLTLEDISFCDVPFMEYSAHRGLLGTRCNNCPRPFLTTAKINFGSYLHLYL